MTLGRPGKGSVGRPTDPKKLEQGIDALFPTTKYKVPGTECDKCQEYPLWRSGELGIHCIKCGHGVS